MKTRDDQSDSDKNSTFAQFLLSNCVMLAWHSSVTVQCARVPSIPLSSGPVQHAPSISPRGRAGAGVQQDADTLKGSRGRREGSPNEEKGANISLNWPPVYK